MDKPLNWFSKGRKKKSKKKVAQQGEHLKTPKRKGIIRVEGNESTTRKNRKLRRRKGRTPEKSR